MYTYYIQLYVCMCRNTNTYKYIVKGLHAQVNNNNRYWVEYVGVYRGIPNEGSWGSLIWNGSV